MTAETPSPTPSFHDSPAVRDYLVEALRLDLVGPGPGSTLADEQLPGWVRPSSWYLTGFLIPAETPFEQRSDEDEDDILDETPNIDGLAEESSEDRKAAKKGFFPSSIGLSFLVSAETERLHVTIRWGDYDLAKVETEEKSTEVWQRHPRERSLEISLPEKSSVHEIPDSGGLKLHALVRPLPSEGMGNLPAGTRSASLFLTNHRPSVRGEISRTSAFQAEIQISADTPFVPHPDPRVEQEWDGQVADLHYHDTAEYAVGHGVSAEWELVDGECHLIRSTWIPTATVANTKTVPMDHTELSMERLGSLTDGESVEVALRPLVENYRAWIETQRRQLADLTETRRQTAEELLRRAGLAADRIDQGIDLLASDPHALDAFRMANRAVSRALRRRLDPNISPRWRPFQLAFILLNLPGLADGNHPQRRIVDLLFFPTGGGKTEAYLGLAAFTMVLRRHRRPGQEGRHGVGVAVVMRYTLRLLTLDQLARASGLVCALELERQQDPDRYGVWPFEIGLWVGKAATPNIMGRKGDNRSDTARAKTLSYKANPRGKPSPIPLEDCPWCGERFEPDSFNLLPDADNPAELRIVCVNFECEFSGDRYLPILAVDEPIYRRLPAFLIATVDKFASLPWTAPTGALLGGANRFDKNGFYGAADPQRGRLLGRALAGPDLIIQDELHLISGPLGTMAGLYETVIEALCVNASRLSEEGRAVGSAPAIKPKIVASTATVRQAQDQVQALFGRSTTQVFPAPGPNRNDSFFARVVPPEDSPGRLYLGITSPGRNAKILMRRVWLALMGAAQRAYREAGGRENHHNPADPYMTVVGYFNSLRELGGARRILEEQVHNTAQNYGNRKRVNETYEEGLFRDRSIFSEVVELTSRVTTDKVADARRRLSSSAHERDRVDSAIATNMISVGLDIARLGLMVVVGQPKTHSEYIQATSRVGRDEKRPGLVVTLLNAHKPRDRSHYERFLHHHETFYSRVEVGSVTPFSARALDRGLAGAVVGYARHAVPSLTQPHGAGQLESVRAALEKQLKELLEERVNGQPFGDEGERNERLHNVRSRVVDLLDSWLAVVADYEKVGGKVKYQKYERQNGKPLLREMLDEDFESPHHRKFRANRSLRDVEPSVNLYIKPLTPGNK